MPSPRQTSITGWLALLCGIWLLAVPAAAQNAGGYYPVAPPAAMIAALQLELKVVKNWIDDKDFASAAQTMQGMQTLGELTVLANDHDDWRKRGGELRSAGGDMMAAIKKKDGKRAGEAAGDYGKLLAEMVQVPVKVKGPLANFKAPAGSTKTWMLLMEGAHVEARSAKTTKEIELFAQAIAEEANAVAYLKTEPRWRTDAVTVRDSALQAAKQAQGTDLDAAKKALKTVYQRCEACHERTRKK
jgi:hypothetical protein